MDGTADPCDNFYKFSCGGYMNRKIPNGHEFISVLNDAEKVLQQQWADVLKSKDKKQSMAEKVLNKFFTSCNGSGENREVLLKEFEKLGGFPVLKANWNASVFDITNTIGYTHKFGFGKTALLQATYMWTDTPKNWDIWSPEMPLEDDLTDSELRNNSKVTAYLTLMVNTVNLLGANNGTSRCEMEEVLKFMIALQKIVIDVEENYDSSHDVKVNAAELPKHTYEINLAQLAKYVIEPVRSLNDVTATFDSEMFRKLDILISKNFTKRTVANYLLWSITFDSLPYMEEPFLLLLDQFKSVKNGRPNSAIRKDLCEYKSGGPIGVAKLIAYVNKHISPELHSKLRSISENIKSSFHGILNNTNYLNEKGLESLKIIVGAPVEMYNKSAMQHYLSKMTFTDSSYGNIKILNSLEHEFAVRKKIDHYDWEFVARELAKNVKKNKNFLDNSFYFRATWDRNAIVRAGLLDQLFNGDYPKFRNYGNIGFFLGRNLFLIYGKYQYNLLIPGWKCIANQYANYTFNDRTLESKYSNLREFENMADQGALHEAYLAYQKVIKEDVKLNKLGRYTKAQLFWISAAQVHCAKYTLKGANRTIDMHNTPTIAKYRVIGMMSSQKAFAEDFNCSASSGMNPLKKCVLWKT
ncbi:Uncharacterised protein g631 [Pycnogonum litorale]